MAQKSHVRLLWGIRQHDDRELPPLLVIRKSRFTHRLELQTRLALSLVQGRTGTESHRKAKQKARNPEGGSSGTAVPPSMKPPLIEGELAMLRVVVRLSVAFCMIIGAGLSVRADPTQAINQRQLSSADRARGQLLRAQAYFTRGEFDRVIADSTAALRAEPNYEGALRVRGLARLYAGRPKAAIDDFAAAVRLTPSDALGVILLHIAQVRAQQSDDQEFAANVARVDRWEWPGRLVEVLTGGATADQVCDFLMAASDEPLRRTGDRLQSLRSRRNRRGGA